MIDKIIQWIFANFVLFMLIIAIALIAINRLFNPRLFFYETSYKHLALFPLGITAIYAFIMHAFFPEFTAAAIGWANSPFQFEVAMANLAIGVIAVLSVYGNSGFRWATVIATMCWLWGDAIGHLYQIIVHHNFAIGNAGSWFYMDILVPLLLLICILKIYRRKPW